MCQVRRKGKEKVNCKKKEQYKVNEDLGQSAEERCKLQRKEGENREQYSKHENNDQKEGLKMQPGERKTEQKRDLEKHDQQRRDKERTKRREQRENGKKELELID